MKTNVFFFLLGFLCLPVLLQAQSLQDQLNNAQPGDIIEFSGTQSGHFETTVHGTASNPIIIRGAGTDAVIDGGGTGSGYGLIIRHDYYRLENFTIRNCKKALYIENAHHGIARDVHMEDIGQEALKVKRNSSYWLFENCSTLKTGLSGDYGEGFYVGDADSNWESTSQADTPHYITFLNCTATDPVNDGFDVKEGAHHVKLVNCAVNWVDVIPKSAHGNSGYYSRGDDIQYINCSIEGNTSTGPAFKHFQNDASDGNRYGYRIELKGISVKDHGGDAIHFHRNDIAQSSVLYDDYTLQNVSGNLFATAEAPIKPASEFVEMTWDGEGGEVYGSADSGSGDGGMVAVTGVEVSPTSLSLHEGETGTLTATISPDNATNKEVSWSSDNEAVATVNAEGVVTALAEGTAVITATSSDGGFSDNSQITVESTGEDTSCDFGTPSASALPSITQEYAYAHVVGSGPALDNFKEFSIKWKLPSNGLHKFAINTTDGVPDYYNDLRGNTTHNFSSSQPGFILSGSGIDGLDGEYWIAIHEGNIVWEEKNEGYIIYYSNSATPPSCASGAGTLANAGSLATDFTIAPSEGFQLYPNPASEFFTIQAGKFPNGAVIEMFSLSGRLILKEKVGTEPGQRISLEGVKPGVYLLKVGGKAGQLLKIIKE
jgi:uncharacterized protein YjdB